jgi:hypothetical protein
MQPDANLHMLKATFTTLVVVSATQGSILDRDRVSLSNRRSADVATEGLPLSLVAVCALTSVQGWALIPISPPALSFASVAQTVGLNAGWYASFPVLLALTRPTVWCVWYAGACVKQCLMARLLQ